MKQNMKQDTGEDVNSMLVDQFNSATRTLQKEVKKHPYQVLGAAASFGYLFGQGWLRGFFKLGAAYFAQQAAKRALPFLEEAGSRNLKNETVH